tara:strand:+ start:388 stop:1143 length:756 start_codon:yes stop_codon:yes gene_type:complete
MKPYVKLNIENSIATIEFFHPQSNSLPSKILNEIADKINDVAKNDDVKVVILKSSGDRVFCAGASFDELLEIKNEKLGKEFFSGFANIINAARKCPKFIIGRVQGKTVGGGVGMAAAVDYCFASKFASIKLSELSIGIGPFVVAPPIERKIGVSGFSQLAINATEWHDANWAREKGLYFEVYETIEDMDVAISNLACKLSSSNPDSMRELKKIMWKGTSDWDELLIKRAAISGKRVLSDFTKNTLQRLKNK